MSKFEIRQGKCIACCQVVSNRFECTNQQMESYKMYYNFTLNELWAFAFHSLRYSFFSFLSFRPNTLCKVKFTAFSPVLNSMVSNSITVLYRVAFLFHILRMSRKKSKTKSHIKCIKIQTGTTHFRFANSIWIGQMCKAMGFWNLFSNHEHKAPTNRRTSQRIFGAKQKKMWLYQTKAICLYSVFEKMQFIYTLFT